MTDDFASKITRKIAENAITPRPRLWFLATRAAFWSFTAVAALIGAISVATLIFYFVDKTRTGGKGFDEMPLDDFFEIIPYFWFGLLVLAAVSATMSFRATNRGYLWHPASVFAALLLFSLVAGAGLYFSRLGPLLNRELADLIPSYARIIAVEDWRNISPDAGRLVGESLGMTQSGQLLLRDFAGVAWVITVAGAEISLDEPLGSDEDIDMTGTRTGPAEFAATTITDWH